MTTHDETIAKIRLLPESLVQEVNDFIDFLVWKSSSKDSSSWLQFNESLELLESDFTDYLSNLEDYENRLARGEIQW
ncbi:DUF2281 domain-containing protein [Nostocaceae cyanobacterium CENA369]|uniref:DUF2281 domain-containing protein n=1 Tax=Dendronalium phyllosphericum CENA369 TaxID=1725256 RepID=A0A8J7LF32_9NOST|nr:DUF2281 domain-containing protein [Dendronalium phyllosphericum]MBH8575572.1 DUF2281 domain-containing protein [Dendronalium phyllosphericum CENA369]